MPIPVSTIYGTTLARAGGGALSVAHYVPHEFVLFCCGMYIYIVCSPFRKKKFIPYMRTQQCTLARTSTTRYPTVLNVTQRHTLYSANQTAGNTIEGVWINTTVAIIPERGDEGCHCCCEKGELAAKTAGKVSYTNATVHGDGSVAFLLQTWAKGRIHYDYCLCSCALLVRLAACMEGPWLLCCFRATLDARSPQADAVRSCTLKTSTYRQTPMQVYQVI